MDVPRPFRSVFRDPDWLKKMALTCVVLIVPVLNLAVSGYYLEYQRRVAYGHDETLPSWGDLGEHFVEGFKLFLGMMVYLLPIGLLVGASIGIPIAAGVLSEGDEIALSVSICGMFLLWAVTGVLYVIVLVGIQGAVAHYNQYRELPAFFEVREIWERMRANAGQYFAAWGLSMLLSLLALAVTTPVTYVISMFSSFAISIAGIALPLLALAGFFLLGLIVMVIQVVPMVPAMLIGAHYTGQYMRAAYGIGPPYTTFGEVERIGEV